MAIDKSDVTAGTVGIFNPLEVPAVAPTLAVPNPDPGTVGIFTNSHETLAQGIAPLEARFQALEARLHALETEFRDKVKHALSEIGVDVKKIF